MRGSEQLKLRRTQDKILVFVSSRILECEQERAIVRDAVLSINHQPVLFEHLGARPYPARELYLSRLRDSQVMVAVYKDGYGFIDSANGMEISGLEDEYQYAKSANIRMLVYIHRDESHRDSRLKSLIDDASSKLTLSFYDTAEQLRSRVRDDLTALITEACLDSLDQASTLADTSVQLLARAEYRSGVVVKRDDLVEAISSALKKHRKVALVGPAGIGKTTAAAQFAAEKNALYLRVSGMAPKEIYAVCSSAIAGRHAQEMIATAGVEAAREQFKQAWRNSAPFSLVLDECDFIEDVLAVVGDAEQGFSCSNVVLFTSRVALPSLYSVEVPPFTRDEVAQVLKNSSVDVGDIDEGLVASGNPLLIQSALAGRELGVSSEDFSSLSGTAGELLRYLAIASVPLLADEVLEAVGNPGYTIAALYDDVERVRRLIDDGPKGLQIVHASISEAIVSQLRKSPQRVAFYANRLTLLFDRQDKPLRSYKVRQNLRDGSESQYALAAAREAARLGDWKVGIEIAEHALKLAIDKGSRYETLHLLLALIYPLELSGNHERAAAMLSQAEELAPQLDANAGEELEEARLAFKARRGLSAGDIQSLVRLYNRYETSGRKWEQAKVALELSAIYISSKQYESAIAIIRPAVNLFEALGDEYGLECATRNLASALSSIEGREAEAEQLIARIEARAAGDWDGRRQRAWYCNLLTRRLRQSGRYEEAKASAQEAISIAEELGDQALRSLNLVNLGNALRDDGHPLDARRVYEEAATIAKTCGRTDLDADASRLIAGLLNDFEEFGSSRLEEAKFYAEHAVGLLKETVYFNSAAYAYVELADSLAKLGRKRESAAAFFSASGFLIKDHQDEAAGGYFSNAVRILLPEEIPFYLKQLSGFVNTESLNAEDVGNSLIDAVRIVIDRVPRSAFIPVLGRHLSTLMGRLPKKSQAAVALRLVDLTFSREVEEWRALYAGLVFSSIGEGSSSFYQHCVAKAVTRVVSDVFCREEGRTRTWTVILDLGRPVTLSIAPLDDSTDSAIGCFALAMFFKAFERDLSAQILGSVPVVDEVIFQVARFDKMPEELKVLANNQFGLEQLLADEPCIVSRATSFESGVPVLVFLSSDFAKKASFWSEDRHLQGLFAYSVVELALQLLKGQVEEEALRPKVISLVSKTLS